MSFGDLAADPHRDAAYRLRAYGLAEKLRQMMLEIATEPDAMRLIAETGHAVADMHIGLADREGDPTDLGLPEDIRFTLVLRTHREPVAAFSSKTQFQEDERSNMAIILNFLPLDARQAATSRHGRRLLQKYLAGLFQTHRDVIVHEVIHMFDYLRGNKTFEKEAAYSRATGAQYRVLYFNAPEEFNALFQQAVVQIENILRRASPGARNRILKTFEGFSQAAEALPILIEMRRSMLPWWEKKLDVRLWQTWEYFKENRK